MSLTFIIHLCEGFSKYLTKTSEYVNAPLESISTHCALKLVRSEKATKI
jgi:hypothetical protein